MIIGSLFSIVSEVSSVSAFSASTTGSIFDIVSTFSAISIFSGSVGCVIVSDFGASFMLFYLWMGSILLFVAYIS